MNTTDTIMSDLVAGYSTYADPAEVAVEATTDAPAAFTTPVCVTAVASSWKCAAAAGAAAATIMNGC